MTAFFRFLPLKVWMGIGALLAFLLLSLGYCASTERAKKAQAQADVAAAQSDIAADGLRRLDDMTAATAANHAATAANSTFITGATNADQDAGDAGNRGRLAYCERQRVRNAPEPGYCAELRRAYSAVTPQPGR